MGVIRKQSISNSIIFYLGMSIGAINTVLIYPNVFNDQPEHWGLIQLIVAYALVLSEVIGKRRLPIIIGGFEAQAIAIELEKMTPSRPLTHDLFKNFSDHFNINLVEVIIYNLVEGIFFAKLTKK